MKITKKRLLSYLLCFCFSLSISFPLYASESSTNYEVSLDEAKEAALVQIATTAPGTEDNDWELGVKITEISKLYDLNDELNAYLFQLENIHNENCGYIIISASKLENPVIEYSVDGEAFLSKACDRTVNEVEEESNLSVKPNKSKLYYVGDITYLVEHELSNGSTVTYDISTNNSKEIEKEDCHETTTQSKANLARWETIETTADAITDGSNPPDNGSDFIYTPSNYESDYQSSKTYTVENGLRNYNIMTDFSSGGVCAPTAATNLCEYWYYRDSSTYGPLLQDSWQNVFQRFYTLMGTTLSNGTYDSAVANAYVSYFTEKGINCTASLHRETNSGADIMEVLSKGSPCHLMVHNHYRYSNHSVLALGYQEFNYKDSDTSSIYIQIADGWTSYPSRYVWGGCSGYWNYVTVNPS